MKEKISKNYKCDIEKKIVEGYDCTAMYPKKHSRVKGIAVKPYSDIPWVFYPCFVLWKNKEQWEHLDVRSIKNYDYAFGGVFPLLFALENENTRIKYLKNYEINQLRKNINVKTKEIEKDSKRLELLLANK